MNVYIYIYIYMAMDTDEDIEFKKLIRSNSFKSQFLYIKPTVSLLKS
jgi:hypothetical protein